MSVRDIGTSRFSSRRSGSATARAARLSQRVSRPFWRAHRRDARRHVWTRGTAGVRDDECGPVRGTVAIVATIALMVALAFQVV